MRFDLLKSYEILERTPSVLKILLRDLHEDWIMNNEGPETFSPYDVIGHLIHGEKTDWAARTKVILELGLSKTFEPWDRFAQFEASKGKKLTQLLDEFERLRYDNVLWLKSLNLSEEDLDKKGMHPVLGEVTLRNLLATWVVHDLGHIAQAARVMAKQYREPIGPWRAYLPIVDR